MENNVDDETMKDNKILIAEFTIIHINHRKFVILKMLNNKF